MSQATLTPDLLSLPTAQTSLALSGFPKFFAVRSSLLTLLATGAIAVVAAVGIARLSDGVVESNERSAAAINSVPPPVYYQFIAQFHDDADAANDPATPATPAAGAVDATAGQTAANAAN